MVILFGTANNFNGTLWCQPWFGNDGNANPAFAGGVPAPLPNGTLSRFVLRHCDPIAGPVNVTYTLVVDGVDTAVVLALAAASAGPVVDNATVVAVTQGQLIQLRAVSTGAVTPRPVLTMDYLRA